MRISMSIDGVQPRGTLSLRQPLIWPIWFVVDDNALRLLLGDTSAEPVVHAPGPQPASQALSFTRELASATLPSQHLRTGLALFCTEGGQDEEPSARYATLQTRIQALALRQAARAAGLSPLLQAFGLSDGPEDDGLDDRLAKGQSLDALDELDLDRAQGLFSLGRAIAQQRSPTRAPVRLESEEHRSRTPERTESRTLALANGTLLASLVQTWKPAALQAGASVDLRRTLPSPTSLRASLSLSGLVRRDG